MFLKETFLNKREAWLFMDQYAWSPAAISKYDNNASNNHLNKR